MCVCVMEVLIFNYSLDYAAIIKSLISDDITYNISHYHAHYAPPPSDHGTTHISVLSPDGMAVSVTSSVKNRGNFFRLKFVHEKKSCLQCLFPVSFPGL